MRNLPKGLPPQVLTECKESWERTLAENQTEHNKNRYRHHEIKAALLEETYHKCVYCESKVGHNCPGDIEHKIPKARRLDLIFDWNNMTIACNECNRRKSDYYDPECMFLDPNVDDVEKLVIHVGPFVFNVPGESRSEVTIRVLELSSFHGRKELLARKVERIELIRNLAERIAREKNPMLKQFMLEDLLEHCTVSEEFSGMIKTFIEGIPGDWANNGS